MGGTLREFFLCICTIADRLSAASLKNFLRQDLTRTDVWIIMISYLSWISDVYIIHIFHLADT